jgi:hypothetical protein
LGLSDLSSDLFLIDPELVAADYVSADRPDAPRDPDAAALSIDIPDEDIGLLATQLVEHKACHRAGQPPEDWRGKSTHHGSGRRRYQSHQPVQ